VVDFTKLRAVAFRGIDFLQHLHTNKLILTILRQEVTIAQKRFVQVVSVFDVSTEFLFTNHNYNPSYNRSMLTYLST
jgi:hypothetical protein